MAKLSMAARKKLPSKSFALPGKGKGPSGKGAGSYPIPDASHARNALSRVSQHGTSSEKATVKAKVHRKFPNIGKKQMGGMVPRMPRPPRVGGVGGMPKAPALVGASRPMRPPPITPRIAGRLSSAAGMKKGGVSSFPKPHTYQGGGVVKGKSGDQSPATCGSMKGHGGFAALGIHKS
jgi:hypothetical protein